MPGWTDAIPPADERYRQRYFDYRPLTEPILRRVMAHYYATITQLDHQLGLLLDLLRQRDLYDDTLIIFTADHGEYLGFHHLLLKDGPMYDPVIKVPLVIKFPGRRRSGEVADQLVSLIDIAPTVLAACGERPVHPLPGRDLADPAAGHEHVFAEDRRHERAGMIRSGHYKLLWSDAAGESLFDLAADPYEFNNLIDDPAHADARRRLREAAAHWALHEATPPTYLDPAAPVRTKITETDRAERRELFATAVTHAVQP